MVSDRRWKRWLRVAHCALWLCCATTAAHEATAQPAEPSAADRETARTLMRTGDTKLAAGDYQGAVADYQAADLIMAVPVTRNALSKAQEKAGLLLEARDTALSVARIEVAADEPDPYRLAREESAERARALKTQIPALRFALTGVAEGVVVSLTVDGQEIPPQLVQVPRKLNPGAHTVVASAEGYERSEVTVNVAAGETRTVSLTLTPVGTPGDVAAPTPTAPAPTDAPAVPPPDDQPAADSDGGGLSPLVWIGFGVGAAGLIVGGVFGGLAAGKAGDLKDSCPNDACPPETQDDYDSTYTFAHVSTVGFVVGGVGAALGVVGLVISGGDDGEEAAAALRLQTVVGLGHLGIQGAF